MGYTKYTSLENHYNNKYVNGLLLNMPEVDKMLFQITEKIDGSNFQIQIKKDEVRYGKRNSWLEWSDNFYDFRTIVSQEKVQTFIKKVQESLEHASDTVNIFGEIYGPGIQKRIQYGVNKDIRLFEMKLNGQWKSPKYFCEYLSKLNCLDLHAPILGIVEGLEDALDTDTNIPTKLFEYNSDTDVKEAQEIEGIVIKPYLEPLLYRNSHVVIKKKNKAFAEKMGVKHKERKEIKFTELQTEFLTYLTDNRMLSVVSQYGELESPKDIGKYIGLLTHDAFNDFAKDQGWDTYTMDKKDKKPYLSIAGANAAEIVKRFL